MAYDPATVANRFLELATERSKRLTPMQLIKLTYIAHGFSLAIFHRPLINEGVEAWRYGPVIPSLYRLLKNYGSGPVAGPLARRWGRSDELDDSDRELVDDVFEKYGGLSGTQLSYLTHKKGTPWEKAYEPDVYGVELDESEIQSHYEGLLNP
jgi:uncharacterized phage-associated protein